MSVAFLFHCFGLVEGTPPVFLFVCHTGFSVMRHGSRQRLSLGQQVLCSRELIRLQLASRYSACLCTPVPVWDGGGKALMDQNIDTRILFKCIHGLTLSLRRKEKKNLFCNKSLRWWTKTLTQEFLSACYFNPLSSEKQNLVSFWLMHIMLYIIMHRTHYKSNYKRGATALCDGMCTLKTTNVYIFDYRCRKINNDDIFIAPEI